ncbi:unnamed protein product, partial [Mesorhabditis belari]|uniref:Uncharacterized protein n=1 Tax=Mesorhabditis belari TaxID=2138241 RepID=A0AAF3FI54_9BILA
MLLKFLLPCLLFVFSKEVLGAHECVWITGQVNCQHDPSKNLNVEIRVYDRDSTFFLLKLMDPDDLMGVTFSSENGLFSLDGCGDDFDWVPGFKNKPEPYIQIRHYCNKAEGETITLPEFSTFVPNTYELGTFQLDGPSNGAPKVNLKTNRT